MRQLCLVSHRREHRLIRCIMNSSIEAQKTYMKTGRYSLSIITDKIIDILVSLQEFPISWDRICVNLLTQPQPNSSLNKKQGSPWTSWLWTINNIRNLWSVKVEEWILWAGHSHDHKISWWGRLKVPPTHHLFCLPLLLLFKFLLRSFASSPLILKARLWSADGSFGKLFGNPNLSEIIWLQPPIMCWFGGIRGALRSNDFHFMFKS